MGKHKQVFSQAVSETKYFILGVGLVLSLAIVIPTFAQGMGGPMGGQPGGQGGKQMGGQPGPGMQFPGGGAVGGQFPGQGKGVEGVFPGQGQGLNKDFGSDKNLKQFGEDFGKQKPSFEGETGFSKQKPSFEGEGEGSLNEKFNKQKPSFEGEGEGSLNDKFSKQKSFQEGEGEQGLFGKKPAQSQEGEQGMSFDQKKGSSGQFGKMPPSKKINKQLRPKLDAAKLTKSYDSALLKLEGGTNEKTGKVTKGVIETLTDKIAKAKNEKRAFSAIVSAAKSLQKYCKYATVNPNIPVEVDVEEIDCLGLFIDTLGGLDELSAAAEDEGTAIDLDAALKSVTDANEQLVTAIGDIKSAIETAVEDANTAQDEEQQSMQDQQDSTQIFQQE